MAFFSKVYLITLLLTLPSQLHARKIETSAPGHCSCGPLGPLRCQPRATCSPPVDDKTKGSVDPWTSPIECLRGNSGQGKPFCVFSSPDAGDGNGLSVVTTPEVAAHIASTSIFESTSWNKTAPRSGRKGRMYDIGDIKGKEKGVIAIRPIRKGDIFMVDYPVLLLATDFVGMASPGQRGAMTRDAVELLPKETKRRVMQLSKTGEGDEMNDVVNTNACSVTLEDGMSHMGLFLEVSKMNHACRPNAFYRFSKQTLKMEVVAHRDIRRGEEININYAYLGMPSVVRQEFLFTTWHFNCTCELCTAPEEEVEVSDVRRFHIARLREKVNAAYERGELEEAVKLSKEVVGLLDEEDLEPLKSEFYAVLARSYRKMGALAKAKRLGERALKDLLQYNGDGDERVENMRIFLKELGTLTKEGEKS